MFRKVVFYKVELTIDRFAHGLKHLMPLVH